MTFPSVLKGLPAKFCLLPLVSALFTRAAVAATLHPRYAALALALQHGGHGGGGGAGGGSGVSGTSAAIIAAVITVIGGIIVAIINRSGKG